MKQNITEFSREDKLTAMQLYFEGYTPRDIAALLDWPYYNTLYILRRMIDEFNVNDYLSFDRIPSEKILIISDTHLGSQKENIDYIKEAYKIAADKGINIAVHGGDLIQSTYAPIQTQYVDQFKQVEHVVKDYPEFPGFKTFVLFGNHDLNTFSKDPEYLKILQTRKDLEVMGCKRAYLTWLGNMISIYHSAKRYRLSIPKVDCALDLKGHAHKLSTAKNYIYIPSASDDMIQNVGAKPGFLIGTQKDATITLESYHFEDELIYDGPVLTKKLK